MPISRTFTAEIRQTERGDWIVKITNAAGYEKSWIIPNGKVQLFYAFSGPVGEAARFLFGEAQIAMDRGIPYLKAAMAGQRKTRLGNHQSAPPE